MPASSGAADHIPALHIEVIAVAAPEVEAGPDQSASTLTIVKDGTEQWSYYLRSRGARLRCDLRLRLL